MSALNKKRRYSQHSEQPAVFTPTSSKQRRLSTISPQVSINADVDSGLNYCLGAIQYIKLTNFMSHHDFEWKPGPKINLITGRNGAGKSSILQAIVIGLGENAKATRRSQNLLEFVNNDAGKAEIIIHLCNIPNENEGESAYRPDFYGNAIIFHRQIYKNGTSVYTIKGLNGERTGAAATEERAKIVSHLSLDIGNPTVVLQQEEAKSFFRNHDPKSMYQFFEKGSLLMDVRESMCENGAEIKNFENTLLMEVEDINARQKVIDELKEVQGLFQKNVKFQDKMTMKQKWAKVKNELKPKFDKFEKEYNAAVKNVKSVENNLEIKENALAKKYQSRDEVKVNVATLKDQYENVDNTYKEKKTAFDKDERYLKNLQTEVAELEREIGLHNQNTQKERNLYLAQNKNHGEAEETLQQLQSELDHVEKQKINLEMLMSKNGNERDETRNEIKEWDNKGNALAEEKRRKQNEKKALRSEENTLNQSKNELAKYGRQMESLCQDIERNSNRFSSRPIGPLGKYIKLSSKVGQDDNLANLIQNQVGINLIKSFLVQNGHDRDILFSLMKKQNFYKQPVIYTKKSEGKRYDVSKRRAADTSGASIMLDYLEFKDDQVFNLVVDRVSPENILITTEKRAQELFSQKRNVPKNASHAITEEWNSYKNKVSYSSYYIRKPNHVTTFLIQEEKLLSRQFEAKHQVINKEIKALEDEEKKNSEITRELNLKLQKNIDQNVKDIAQRAKLLQDINKFKSKIQKKNQNIRTEDEWKITFEHYHKKKQDTITAKQTKNQEISARKVHLEQQRSELAEMVKTRDKFNANYNKVHDEFSNLEKIVRSLETDKESTKKNLDEAKRKIVKAEAEYKEWKNKYDKARAEALELSNGRELSNDEIAQTNAEFQAMERERIAKEVALKKKYENNNKVVRELKEKIKEIGERKQNMEINRVICTQMKHGISKRTSKILEVKTLTSREVRRVFNEQIRDCNMKGEIDINAKRNMLEIKIKPTSESPEPVPLSSLSGGEKSKTLACLIRSFWQFQRGPFKGLDEWDVFLDDKSRKDVETMLVEGAKKFSKQQFFFISPQNSAYNNPDMRKLNGDRVVIMDLEKSGDRVNNNR